MSIKNNKLNYHGKYTYLKGRVCIMINGGICTSYLLRQLCHSQSIHADGQLPGVDTISFYGLVGNFS